MRVQAPPHRPGLGPDSGATRMLAGRAGVPVRGDIEDEYAGLIRLAVGTNHYRHMKTEVVARMATGSGSEALRAGGVWYRELLEERATQRQLQLIDLERLKSLDPLPSEETSEDPEPQNSLPVALHVLEPAACPPDAPTPTVKVGFEQKLGPLIRPARHRDLEIHTFEVIPAKEKTKHASAGDEVKSQPILAAIISDFQRKSVPSVEVPPVRSAESAIKSGTVPTKLDKLYVRKIFADVRQKKQKSVVEGSGQPSSKPTEKENKNSAQRSRIRLKEMKTSPVTNRTIQNLVLTATSAHPHASPGPKVASKTLNGPRKALMKSPRNIQKRPTDCSPLAFSSPAKDDTLPALLSSGFSPKCLTFQKESWQIVDANPAPLVLPPLHDPRTIAKRRESLLNPWESLR